MNKRLKFKRKARRRGKTLIRAHSKKGKYSGKSMPPGKDINSCAQKLFLKKHIHNSKFGEIFPLTNNPTAERVRQSRRAGPGGTRYLTVTSL
jgi:hypothetical protein